MNEGTFKDTSKTEICRLCLAHTKVFYSLTPNQKTSQMLKALTAIEIEPFEQISSIMCYKCRLNLNLAYNIQQNMLKAEEKFKTRFALHKIKEEFEFAQVKVLDDYANDEAKVDVGLHPPTNGDYTCDICDKNFKDKNTFRKHNYNHLRKKCPVCGKDLLATTFGRHMKKHTSKEEEVEKPFIPTTEYICDICRKCYSNKHKLRGHLREVHTRINCEVCNIEITKASFRKHMRRQHLQEWKEFLEREKIPQIFECDSCTAVFPNKTKLTVHKTRHQNWSCPTCGKEMQAIHMKQHMEVHSTTQQEPRWTCPTCGKEMQTTNMQKHLELHKQKNEDTNEKPLKCSLCDKTFIAEWLRKRHETNHKRIRCPICDRDVLKVNLQQHIRTHSDAYKQICELCGATLKNKFCLKLHMIRAHQNNEFKCKYCDKVYRSKKNTKIHELKEHLRQANHVCDICGKKFYGGVYLRRHVEMKHLKLRPYNCDVCKKGFSSSFALKTHQRIHTNETPFKCQECGEGFRQKVSLKTHLKSKHNIEEVITHFCELCEKGFGSAVALYTHQRVHDP